ncbi:L,D-transpeptidase [Faunimonas sp. B44]|uniref:L,D-transpeptidase n=1 Tax=Faunimonas sp. B44 TaxID=3461493 RepID=UPI004044B801
MGPTTLIDRRLFLSGAGALLASACTQSAPPPKPVAAAPLPRLMLVPETPEPFPVAAVDLSKVPPQFHRQMVADPTGEPPGTVVIDTGARYLYLVMEGGMAMRYGVGIGRDGFEWNGDAVVGDRQEWPKWFPPKEMIERQPELAEYANGMDGGPANPLGARALYLYQGRKDTLYRIHGTAEVASIGRAVSSGCVRLLNADVIDLYNRVPLGARVVVLPPAQTLAA